jgi:hypothetical protein
MSLYSLTESYSEIYDHRKAEDLFDNLRFLDYMQDEDIQEVVESLVWEFRDYGNTLAESFDMLDHAVTVPVLYESYDELIGDVLYEAALNPYAPAGSAAARQYSQYTAKSRTRQRELSSDPGRRAADRASRLAAANTSVKKRIENASDKVRSKLSGPISSVKQSISGSAGGIGRAAKNMGGAVVDRGKALLKSLLRRGGKAVKNVGKSIEASGTRASQQAPKTTSVRVGKTTLTATKEPGGSKRQMVGRAIKRVGKALQKRAGKKDEPRMSRTDYEQRKAERTSAAKKEVGDAFTKPKVPDSSQTPTKTGPVRASLGNVKPSQALSGAIARQKASTATQPTTSGPFQGPMSKTKPQGPKAPPAQGPRRPYTSAPKPAPKSRARRSTFKSPEAEARYNEMKKGIKEDYQLEQILKYISEDLIEAGYAYNIDEAYEIINDLDESTLTEIIYDYLEE